MKRIEKGTQCSNPKCHRAGAVTVGEDAFELCAWCIDRMADALHRNHHSYNQRTHCPACKPQWHDQNEHHVPCRWAVEHCDGCGTPFMYDYWSSYIGLPHGWRVAPMEAMVDFHRFVCSAACAAESERLPPARGEAVCVDCEAVLDRRFGMVNSAGLEVLAPPKGVLVHPERGAAQQGVVKVCPAAGHIVGPLGYRYRQRQ